MSIIEVFNEAPKEKEYVPIDISSLDYTILSRPDLKSLIKDIEEELQFRDFCDARKKKITSFYNLEMEKIRERLDVYERKMRAEIAESLEEEFNKRNSLSSDDEPVLKPKQFKKKPVTKKK
jgi:hypothetical protein